MALIEKTRLELHRDLIASGLFDRFTQKSIAEAIGVNQCTVSRIANGNFKRINKTVISICRYAKISTMHALKGEKLRSLVDTTQAVSDPEKRKLVDIIRLAIDLLENP